MGRYGPPMACLLRAPGLVFSGGLGLRVHQSFFAEKMIATVASTPTTNPVAAHSGGDIYHGGISASRNACSIFDEYSNESVSFSEVLFKSD